MPAHDVAFTFNPAMVLAGVQKITTSLGQMTNNIKGAATGMSKAVASGVLKAAAVVGGLVAAFKGIKSVVQQHIPEIGEAFKIAKDTFFKNFLWPLRKEIGPILQRMLDWVRDNRTRFVKWGQAVANVFRAIVTVAKSVITWGRGILQQIGRIFGALFGDSVRSIEDAWNLLTAKVAIAAVFVGHLIHSILGLFGDLATEHGPALVNIFRGVLESALSFISGFLEGVRGIREPLESIFRSIVDFIEGLFEPNQFGDRLQNVFHTIGKTIGALFRNLVTIVDALLAPFFDRIRNAATPLQDIADSLQSMFDRLFDRQGMENMQSFAGILGEIAGTRVMTGLRTVALLIATIANTIVLLRDALRALFQSGRFSEFFGDLGGWFRGENKLGEVFRFSGADPARREALEQSADVLAQDVRSGIQSIFQELGFNRGGTQTPSPAPITIGAPITIYAAPGQNEAEIGAEAARQLTTQTREALDRERRAAGE